MKNIALTLSGGGFRAAAFSLGTLSYLHSIDFEGKPLLENVKFIGSTSGGSLTNLFYSTSLCQGVPFEIIYQKMLTILTGDQLITNVFKLLHDDKVWEERPQKARNLINAFSLAYDSKDILNGLQFGLFSSKLSNTHLKQITINATEFANGMSFRFQSQNKKDSTSMGRVGNNYIFFKSSGMESADKLKLSDLLACSSCFPAGFEPFIFPDDFTHCQLNIQELTSSINYSTNPFSTKTASHDVYVDQKFKENPVRFGLMDGGVADNQAIDSVLKANNRFKKATSPFDLIIATDVSSYFIDGYTLPMEKRNWLSYFSFKAAYNFIFYFGLLFPLIVIGYFFYPMPILNILLFPTLLSLGIWIWIKVKINQSSNNAIKEKSTWGIELFKFGKYFTKLRISSLKQMLASRTKSVLLLAEDIYLKQIRRHYYNMLYSDPKLSKIIISNAIYDLSKAKQKAKSDPHFDQVVGANSLTEKDFGISPASNAIIATAELARSMPTTLWFDPHQEANQSRAYIIACGQFTTCYNLLKYLKKLESQTTLQLQTAELPIIAPVLEASLEKLKIKLEKDWQQFITNSPFYLHHQMTTPQTDLKA